MFEKTQSPNILWLCTDQQRCGAMLRSATEKIVVYHGTEQGELYDLTTDPDEFTNLCDFDEYQAMKLRLMQRLLRRERIYNGSRPATTRGLLI